MRTYIGANNKPTDAASHGTVAGAVATAVTVTNDQPALARSDASNLWFDVL